MNYISSFLYVEESETQSCVEIQIAPELPPLDPAIIREYWNTSSPIMFMILLCRFFLILTNFVNACQQEDN